MLRKCTCCAEVFDTDDDYDELEESDVCAECIYTGRILENENDEDYEDAVGDEYADDEDSFDDYEPLNGCFIR